MKKLIGILVLFVTMSTTSLNANTNIIVEEVGPGGCFALANSAYNQGLAWGWSEYDAYFFASQVFDDCVSQEQ